MIPIAKRREVQSLLTAGHIPREISNRTGVSMRSVARIAKETEFAAPDDPPERMRRRVGRPSVAAPFRGFVSGILGSLPDAPTCEILDLARRRGYRGGKSAFYDLVARLRAHPVCDRQEERSLAARSTTSSTA